MFAFRVRPLEAGSLCLMLLLVSVVACGLHVHPKALRGY